MWLRCRSHAKGVTTDRMIRTAPRHAKRASPTSHGSHELPSNEADATQSKSKELAMAETVTKGLLVRIEAKPGKESDVENFLSQGKSLVEVSVQGSALGSMPVSFWSSG